MSLISANFRSNFRECCVSLVLRQIHDIFTSAGFRPNETITPTMSGERRGLVEKYYTGINWNSAQDAERFLDVVSVLLSQSYIDDRVKDSVRKHCAEECLVVEGRHVRFGTQIGIPWFLSSKASAPLSKSVNAIERGGVVLERARTGLERTLAVLERARPAVGRAGAVLERARAALGWA
jgi:hypothetical protein